MGAAKRRKKLDPNYGKPTPQIEMDKEGILAIPDYQLLVDGYLKHGSAHLITKIQEWMEQNDPPHIAYQNIDGKLVPNLDRLNKIGETVYILASKQSKALSAKEEKQGTFNLTVPAQPSDYGNYPPIRDNSELVMEGMRLFNTGFFDNPITELINSNNDVVGTLRNHVVLVYMGTNENHEIIDAACSLARLKPFQVIKYIGEERHSLNTRFEKVFKPVASNIEKFRIVQKGADKYPCLTLLFFIENKTNQKFCEFRKHYTAQGGSQLVIPGFSKQSQGIYAGPPLNVLGNPVNIPTIRGYNESGEKLEKSSQDINLDIEAETEELCTDSEDIDNAGDMDNVLLINHQAMTKRLTKPAYVYSSLVKSIHMGVCMHPMFFNRGFCHIKTQKHQITLWLDKPFEKRSQGIENILDLFVREWYGNFTTEILNGKICSVNRKFSMKSLPDLEPEIQMQAMFTGEVIDKFEIEGLISIEVSVDLPPEEITIQAPI